jgi:hypothetical protein
VLVLYLTQAFSMCDTIMISIQTSLKRFNNKKHSSLFSLICHKEIQSMNIIDICLCYKNCPSQSLMLKQNKLECSFEESFMGRIQYLSIWKPDTLKTGYRRCSNLIDSIFHHKYQLNLKKTSQDTLRGSALVASGFTDNC